MNIFLTVLSVVMPTACVVTAIIIEISLIKSDSFRKSNKSELEEQVFELTAADMTEKIDKKIFEEKKKRGKKK